MLSTMKLFILCSMLAIIVAKSVDINSDSDARKTINHIFGNTYLFTEKNPKNLEKLTENVKFVLGDIRRITTNGVQLELIRNHNVTYELLDGKRMYTFKSEIKQNGAMVNCSMHLLDNNLDYLKLNADCDGDNNKQYEYEIYK